MIFRIRKRVPKRKTNKEERLNSFLLIFTLRYLTDLIKRSYRSGQKKNKSLFF